MLLISLFQNPIILIGWILGLIIGITIHEFSHALAANKLGDPTARFQGRLSLNPLAHLDPLGTIFLFLVGFGWGKPVPYNPNFVQKGKWGEFLIALSGPLSNIVLAFIFALPYRLYVACGMDVTTSIFIAITQTIVELNLILAIFNLLPIPPLDGSKIIYLFVSEETKVYLEKIGPFILIMIFIVIYILRINLFTFVLTPLFNWFKYLVNIFPFG